MSNLKENGFEVVSIIELIPQINEFRKEVLSVFDFISKKSGYGQVNFDKDLIEFYDRNQPLQFRALKQLWSNPKLFSLGSSEVFIDKLIELGFEKPNFELQPNLRCDMPVKGQSVFEQHQDYAFNIGSENSCTIWLPLQEVKKENGALLVSPGSHKNGTYPNENGIISDTYKFNFECVPLKLGECLIFDQKLVHQSGLNTSDKVRFSVQLRYTDLGCNAYAERGYPINHKVTTEEYAENTV